MYLTEKTVIRKTDSRWLQLDKLCFLSKNLYNATLFDIRQHFFVNQTFKSYPAQCRDFTSKNNPDYRALPTKISKQTMRQVHANFSSFFQLLKKKTQKNYTKTVKMPKYLQKNGRFMLIVDKESISRKPVRSSIKNVYEYVISKKDVGLHFFTKHQHIQQVRFLHKGNHIIQEVVYEKQDTQPLADNGRYASVDLGVNILAAVYTNTGDSVLLNGKIIKSVNQYYNKRKAHLQKKLGGESHTSRRIQKLTTKRQQKINTLLHESSRKLINHVVSNHINTIIIGYNKEWKQEINIGRRNNQNFTNIPFLRFVQQLEYKAKIVGVNVILHEESYTSKTSFLDKETPQKHAFYAGKRVFRGLFRSANGSLINADINGAAQIMRKVVPDNRVYTIQGIEGCRSPHFI